MMLGTYISDIHIFGIIDHQHRPLYHIQVSTDKSELNVSTVCVSAHVYVRECVYVQH